ncbi:MAG: UDP-N-acetylmuramate--L-alanine ligase, partial [Lachnospiraceae bacterium]|nr:UDP-N-acetylmuramate--L-alanine ligase [Lachnospiraceae bacterium]
DDYAHHPTEINATLSMARHYAHREIWCVFQPHTFTRTKALFNEFVDVLSKADHIILPEIYAARETDTLGMSSELLADALRKRGVDAYFIPDFEKIETFILENCQENDLLITMGAGNVVKIADDLIGK